MPERPLRAREVMERYGIPVSTLHRLAGLGVIPYIRVPSTRIIRFRPERIEELLRRWERNGANGRRRRQGEQTLEKARQ